MKRQAKIGLGGKINILGLGIDLGDGGLGVCPRCGRRHSGPCGIPGTVTGYTPSARPRVSPRPKRKTLTPIYPTKIEPSYDIFEEDSQIKVILDMPGIEKEIEVLLEDKTLKVKAEGKYKFYETEIKLPREVKQGLLKEYRNGILIITLEGLKRGKERPSIVKNLAQKERQG